MRSLAFLTTLALVACSLAAPAVRRGDDKKLSPAEEAAEAEKKAQLQANKYFREPGRTSTLGHYDARYFTEVVSDDERTDTQSHMIRAYLNFFRENDLDTWIAHGSLLGWWWNGQRLPWDSDLDTQVSGATLQHLGDAYNQTRYQYTSSDGEVSREFLLDVNPWIWQRDRGDGMNIIDARWIDIRNGLFIDITGLSEVHADTNPGVWSCKNYHRYKTTELYPMRETMFEGVVAKVPYEYDKILIDEYKESALINTNFHGHEWDVDLKQWVKTQETLQKEDVARRKKEKEVKEKEQAAMKKLQDSSNDPEHNNKLVIESKLETPTSAKQMVETLKGDAPKSETQNQQNPKPETPSLLTVELKKGDVKDSKPQGMNTKDDRSLADQLGDLKLEEMRLN